MFYSIIARHGTKVVTLANILTKHNTTLETYSRELKEFAYRYKTLGIEIMGILTMDETMSYNFTIVDYTAAGKELINEVANIEVNSIETWESAA